jgi:signal transduction histidine kinase
LFLFAFARNRFQQWLTRVVFLRSDLDATLHAIRTQAARSVDESSFLSQAAREVARFLSVTETRLLDSVPSIGSTEPHSLLPTPLGDRSPLRSDSGAAWAEVVVPLRFSRGDALHLLLGPRRGGRRYLSEDLRNLATLASAVVEQIERLRKNELQRLVNQAELRALRAQINPHFLFNSLNTLYGIIPRDLKPARQTVLNLAEIFRYFLHTDAQFSSLSDELRIVKAYLEIESLRLGGRLVTALEIDAAALASKIPILSIQPLVENAVKHGIGPRPEGGSVALIVALQDDELRVEVRDTGVGFPPSSEQAQKGVGLENVRQRLKLCYGEQADLSVQSSQTGSIVGFRIRQPQPAEVHGR